METELSTLKSDMKRIAMIKEESRSLSQKVNEMTQRLEEAQYIIKSHDNQKQTLQNNVNILIFFYFRDK